VGSDYIVYYDHYREPRRYEAVRSGALSQSLPDLYHAEMYGDAPYLTGTGWRPLLNGRDLTGWHSVDQTPSDWFTTAAVEWKRIFSPTHLTAKPGPGDRVVCGVPLGEGFELRHLSARSL
jgi:hypothetical protein